MMVSYAKIKFNVTGAKQKELVNLIANFTGSKAVYKGAPSFAYEVDYFTIDKNGTLIFDDRADSEEIESLLDTLYDNGFTSEDSNTEDEQSWPEDTNLTIEIPIEDVNVDNLTALLEVKGDLIREALGIEDIKINILEDRVSFPWFQRVDTDTAMAYSTFIAAMCRMAKEQKRINASTGKAENRKYAFRCFLLRLGFIGEEFKQTRKILLRNLEGSSAFKNGRKEVTSDNG